MQIASAVTVTCEFKKESWNYDHLLYTCSGSVISPENDSFLLIEGKHLSALSNDQVEALRIVNEKFNLPNDIGGVFPKLTSIQFIQTKISKASRNNFKNLNHLTNLKLAENELRVIRSDVFHDLVELTGIWLQSNQIETLESGCFDRLTKLKLIDLDNNNLTTLSIDLFKHNLELAEIRLDGNKLISFSFRMFEHLQKIQRITLKNNTCINETFNNAMLKTTKNLHQCDKSFRVLDLKNLEKELKHLKAKIVQLTESQSSRCKDPPRAATISDNLLFRAFFGYWGF